MKKILLSITVTALLLGMPSANAQIKVKYHLKHACIQKPQISQIESIDNLTKTFNNEIKAVFCDIDGTIIPKNYPKGKVPDSVKEAAKKLRNANIPMILATGRTYTESKKITDQLGNKDVYFVTLQGSEIIDNNGKLIYKDCIDCIDARQILKQLEKYTKKNCPEAKIYIYFNERPNSKKVFRMPYYWQTVAVVKSYDTLGVFSPSKIGVYEPNPEKLQKLKAYMIESFPKYYSFLATDCLCELTTFTATKGNGVKKAAESMGIDLKNVATFGDAENDISMTSLVKNSGGLAVVVKNGMDELKKNANYETKSVNEGGVNYAVDKILENNTRLKNLN